MLKKQKHENTKSKFWNLKIRWFTGRVFWGFEVQKLLHDLLPEGMSWNVDIYSFHLNFYTSRDEIFQKKSFEIRHEKLQGAR